MRLEKDKFTRRRNFFSILILFSFMISILPGGMRNIKAEELNGEETLTKIELSAEVIWTGVPDDESVPDTIINLMNGKDVVESIEITDGSTLAQFAPVDELDADGNIILYTIEQEPLENYGTEIREFVIENTYIPPVVEEMVVPNNIVEEEPIVEEPIAEEPIVEEPIVEEPIVEEPVVEEPVVTPPLEETPKVDEATTIEENSDVVEILPVEEPVILAPAADIPALNSEADLKSAETVVEETEVNLQADVGTLAVPSGGTYVSDPGFDMIATDHNSTNELTFVKYIWIQNGVLFMAITANNYIDMTDGTPDKFPTGETSEPANKLDVSINGTYPSGVTYYGEPNKKNQPWITIDGVAYSPVTVAKNDMAFWAVIYFEPDNLPPLYDMGNVVWYNSQLGGGHDVYGETFNVVRKNYTFIVRKNWSDNHPPTLPPVTFTITFGGVSNVTTSPLSGTVDGVAEGIAEGQTQGETSPWIYTWMKVPKTNAYGQDYTYMVTESTLTGYTQSGPTGPVKSTDGLTWTYEFTNTYNNDNFDVAANKVWVGGPKPTVYFQLWQKIGMEESIVQNRLLEKITSTDTVANWNDLPQYSGTTLITYFVKEVDEAGVDYAPPNYEKSYSEDRLTITNTYTSPKRTVEATKTWIGGLSDDWSGVPLELYRTIEIIEGVPVNPEKILTSPMITLREGTTNIWDYVWSNLDVTDADGNTFIYYVIEPTVPVNYESVADGLSVVNTYKPPLMDVVAKKIWENGKDEDHVPVTLTLYRQVGMGPKSIVVVDPPSVVPATGPASEFTYTWSDLPKTDNDGNLYIYSVDELTVPDGYEKTVSPDGLTVTNKAKTSDLQLFKTGVDDAPLQGAEFDLYLKVESDTPGAIAFAVAGGGTIYGIRIEDDTYPDGRLKTGADGKTQIVEYLEAGYYFVVERVAPTGYLIHEYPIEFEILSTKLLNEFTIENELAPMIPATGGMGTWLFTIIGVGIMGSALFGFKKHNHNNRGKGENIMKGRKLFTLLFAMLVLFVFAAPSMVKASETNSLPARTTNVTIHKMELFTPKTGLPKDHDGTELSPEQLDTALGSGNYDGLPGVVFKYWVIDDGKTLAQLNPLTEEALDIAYDSVILDPTDADGVITLPNMLNGFYYFREDYTPENVTQQIAVPFLLGLPVMKIDGTGFITDLHIYPKNLTVRGAVELTKTAGEEFVTGAKFRLYKGEPPTGVEYDPEGPDVPTEYVTDNFGKIFIDNLPVGKYYFVETFAPAPYLLNTTPIPFTIAVNETTNVVKVTLDNFEGPDITKSIIEVGTEVGSGDYHEPLDFFIDLMLPDDILKYSKLIVTDMIDTKLDYKNTLVVKGSVDGINWTTLNGTHYSAVEPALDADGKLEITFKPAELKVDTTAFKYIRISFKAAINETAVMGKAIPNKAVETYNNGYMVNDVSEDSNLVNAFTGGKYFKKWNGTVGLQNAEFAVMNAAHKYLKIGTAGEYIWVNTLAETSFRLKSDADGFFMIKGLKYAVPEGTTYYLVETKAPMGPDGYPYNLIEDPIPFLVNGTSFYTNPDSITMPDAAPTARPWEVLNKLGPKIPQTGGIGTVLFTVIGGGLMGSALMLNKKRVKR